MRIRSALVALAVSLFVLGTAALPAAAADPSVTLGATPSIVPVGGTVALAGHITPWRQGETVRLVTSGGRVLAETTTKAQGKFSFSMEPRETVTVHAVWRHGSQKVATSAPVRIGVRAVVTTALESVRLFGGALIRGQVRPWHEGAVVQLQLLRGSTPVWNSTARLGPTGKFQRKVGPITKPGNYRARATFADATHLAGTALSAVQTTPLPYLARGSTGPFVYLLERRLVQLHYYLTGIDQTYDERTADAVVAFRKVQRMDRVYSVNADVWRALADPRTVAVHGSKTGYHIEVDQTLQVMFLVNDGQVSSILHVSTGRPTKPTPDGDWHIYEKEHQVIDGMIYPSWYCWRAAIHGYNPVPTYPHSHGCIRVPPWAAQWAYDHAPMNAEVLIYH